jgi:hypothetical protein
MTSPKSAKYAVLIILVNIVGLYFTCRAAVGYMQYFGSYHDDAIYAVTALSLASGQGYRIISLPMEPFQTKYPSVFAAILSNVFAAMPSFPENLAYLQSLAAFFGIWLVWGAAAYLFVTARAGPLTSIAVAAACWWNLEYVSFIPVTMADIAAGVFSLIAIWLCEIAVDGNYGRMSRKQQVVQFATIAGAFIIAVLTHVMAAFALMAANLYMLWKKRWIPLLVINSVFLAVLMPSWIWASSHAAKAPPVMVYYTNYLQAASSTAEHGHGMFQFVGKNLGHAFTELPNLAIQLLKLVPLGTPAAAMSLPLYIGFWVLLISGVTWELIHRRRYQLLSIWFTIYGCAHLLWPHGVGLRRTLVMLPFVIYYLFSGTRCFWNVAKRIVPRKMFTPLRTASIAVLAALILIGDLRETSMFAGTFALRVPRPTQAPPGYTESSEFAEAYDWIRKNTHISDVIVWNNDPGVFLWTGRKAIMACLGESWGVIAHPEAYITPEDLLQSMRVGHGNYLVVDPISVGGWAGFLQLGRAVEELQQDKKGLLKPVFASKYHLVTIFKIDPVVLDPPANEPSVR